MKTYLSKRAVFVAQLVKRSLPTPEIRGSNADISNCYCIEKMKIKKKRPKMIQFWKHIWVNMFVAQLVEQSLPTLEIRSSNPIISKFYCIEKMNIKKKRPKMIQFWKHIWVNMFVAQLVEQSLPTLEIRSSNPIISKFYCIEKMNIKKKRPEMVQFWKHSSIKLYGHTASAHSPFLYFTLG